mmetsp:Transcript_38202/g.82768  ORF Transcript_38202/g.82768 Transcript_38202/m.82768 type:complete len:287 (+) Transcript_38202:1789-2649(+)
MAQAGLSRCCLCVQILDLVVEILDLLIKRRLPTPHRLLFLERLGACGGDHLLGTLHFLRLLGHGRLAGSDHLSLLLGRDRIVRQSGGLVLKLGRHDLELRLRSRHRRPFFCQGGLLCLSLGSDFLEGIGMGLELARDLGQLVPRGGHLLLLRLEALLLSQLLACKGVLLLCHSHLLRCERHLLLVQRGLLVTNVQLLLAQRLLLVMDLRLVLENAVKTPNPGLDGLLKILHVCLELGNLMTGLVVDAGDVVRRKQRDVSRSSHEHPRDHSQSQHRHKQRYHEVPSI